MKYRKKLGKSQSKRSFSKGASLIHKRNLRANPMRGGIRL